MTPADEVILEPVSHRYFHVPTGRQIPSVSSILRKSGVREAPGVGVSGSSQHAEHVARALKRGSEVHRLARSMDETYDLEDAFEDHFEPADLTVDNINYVAAYDRFLRMSEYRPIAWEVVLYNALFNYACRADGVGWLGVLRVMIDRKTDRTLNRAVWLQLCANKAAWNATYPDQPIDATFAVHLKRDMEFELIRNPVEDVGFSYFTAAIWLAQWKDLVL